MSAWASQATRLVHWRRRLGATRSSRPVLASLLCAALLLRVLTDDLSSPYSRRSGGLNLSAVIALTFILLAGALLLRERRGLLPATLAGAWLCVWTAVAIRTHGASGETLREGIREGSVLALAVIVYNARDTITVPIGARIIQLMGLVPALLAVHQLATHTGIDLAGTIRANGTFAHPDSAAMFFAISAAASLWLYLDNGRRRIDAVLVTLFSAGVIATLSIDGLAALLAMLAALGVLRPGPLRANRAPFLVAALVAVAFFVTPFGAHRIARETTTSIASAERGEANTSLSWRLHKWEVLFSRWKTSPFIGQGLGTTTTERPRLGNRFAGKPPHNEYVRYLVETGVIGFAILLAALVILIRAIVRRRGSPEVQDDDTTRASTFALVVIAGCLVNALADNTLLNSPTCYAVALIVAAALSRPASSTRVEAGRARTTAFVA